ncbi:MAG: tetratricopeptide repeat protein, partial [Chloroflexales bacterium]|nr:tetratricopeptide repeat protein [Chloroflexales bacterium]
VAQGGQVLLSHVSHALVRDHLPPEMSLRDLGSPRLKDLTRAEPLFQLVAPGLRSDFPALPSLAARPTNLPAQPTALIGREREIADLCTLLRRAEVRLVTLTGPGGAGKTRLALQVAAELLDDAPDGVWFVNLAPISDPAAVAPAIAQALSVAERADQPVLATLQAHLRDKRLVLVLDNFEQVLDGALAVAELLTSAPALTALITSRAVLRLQGEHEYAVPPLALPDLHQLPPLAHLSQYAAVALFIVRAQAAKASFTVTNATAPAVAEICHRLDGLPLAIELAAARVKLFAPEVLLARLHQRLLLLTGGARDLPVRQQTLRNAIAWSYDLLDANEQALFRRLGVFVGGCTLEAAEAVGNAAGELSLDVLDGLAALTDKSLLRQEPETDGVPRFTMLETMCEYAVEQLVEHGELEATRRRHAEYFLALATKDEPLGGYDDPGNAWYARRHAERDNLRAALTWSHAAPDGAEIELRLAAALCIWWASLEMLNEAQIWIERALMRREQASVFAQAKISKAAGYLMFATGANTRGIAFYEQALLFWQQLNEPVQAADALLMMAILERNQGGTERSGVLAEQALALFRAAGVPQGISSALFATGDIAFDRGDYAQARALFEEGQALAHQQGNKDSVATALGCLARVAYAEGDYDRATTLYEESIVILRGFEGSLAPQLIELGRVVLAQGNYARATALFHEYLRESPEYLYGRLCCLEGLGGVEAAQGDGIRAARLWGAAEAQRMAADLPRDVIDAPDYERWVAEARTRFDTAAFAAAWEAGRGLSLDEAVEEALRSQDTSEHE